MTEWIVEPGSLLPKSRLTPSGKRDDGRAAAWMQLNTPRAAAALRAQGAEPTPETVTAFLLKEFLLPTAWADVERREAWFRFLLPVVEGELRTASTEAV